MIEFETPASQEDWWDDPTSQSPVSYEEPSGPVRVSHVVDFYNRYPGEVVKFYTRLDIQEPLADLTLRISLPDGLMLGDYRGLAGYQGRMPALEMGIEASYLVWSLPGRLAPGDRYEYQAEAIIGPTSQDVTLISRAVATDEAGDTLSEEAVSVIVRAKGNYIRYLPSLYEGDDFMGRFVMLFESFWAPIEKQVDGFYNYLDPRITPTDHLPWLAAWLDLDLDERWPEARLRQLIRWAIALHRSRGTKWGLLKYLEIYTGQQAEIVERRAQNAVIGPDARMGPGIAIGLGNRPHTFSVTLRLPPIQARRKRDRDRLEEIRRQTIESIIEIQKPAHTVYTLYLETLSDDETQPVEPAQPEAQAGSDEIAAQAAIWFKLDD